MKYTNLKKNASKGFSLIEMLVVIAVIGVIAAIAIPNIGNINGAAKIARDQRNAQSIASVYAAAAAAGVTTFGDGSVDGIAKALIGGVTVPADGTAFAGTSFSVPNVSDADVADAEKYLKAGTDGTGLAYSKTIVAP